MKMKLEHLEKINKILEITKDYRDATGDYATFHVQFWNHKHGNSDEVSLWIDLEGLHYYEFREYESLDIIISKLDEWRALYKDKLNDKEE